MDHVVCMERVRVDEDIPGPMVLYSESSTSWQGRKGRCPAAFEAPTLS